MSDTIRKQIIGNIKDYLANITRNKAYKTDIGLNVYLVQKAQITIPAVIIWPGTEEISREQRIQRHAMNLRIDGLNEFNLDNPSDVSEDMLGDLIEILTGKKFSMPFTSGGTERPEIGDAITGANSGATAILESWDIETGAWADGDAAGTFTIRRVYGTFESENLNIGDETNLATTTGSLTVSYPETLATDDLADDILYISGGAEQYPDQGVETIGASANFQIRYRTQLGNPYQQIT
jgi:hypothetical protein